MSEVAKDTSRTKALTVDKDGYEETVQRCVAHVHPKELQQRAKEDQLQRELTVHGAIGLLSVLAQDHVVEANNPVNVCATTQDLPMVVENVLEVQQRAGVVILKHVRGLQDLQDLHLHLLLVVCQLARDGITALARVTNVTRAVIVREVG